MFVKTLLEKYSPKRVIVYSRDELKQSEMKSNPLFQNSALRFFLGDVRDRERLYLAMRDVDYVVHAAALKQVPAAEYNPHEFIKKNYLKYCNLDGCLNFRNACASSCLTLSLVTPIIDAISSKVKHLPGSFLEIQSQAFLSLTSHEPKKEGILIFLSLDDINTLS